MRFFLFSAILCFSIGCKSEVEELPTPKPLVKKELEEPLKKKEKEVKIPDRIFGLPVPPGAFSHFKIGDEEAVLIKSNLETMKYFYKKNLVDFEVVEQDKRIFIIGLRSFMASATIYHYTNKKRSPLIIKFSAAKTEFEKDEILKKHSRKKGAEVKLRTKDGELVAPGARWGEPYTPPVGTPLYKERYRLNWGKPFGEWKAQ